jgi:hypothetical protein
LLAVVSSDRTKQLLARSGMSFTRDVSRLGGVAQGEHS